MSGLAGLSFVVLWERRAASKPRHSSYVTATELDYIRGKRLKRGMLSNDDTHTPYKKVVGHHSGRILKGPHKLKKKQECCHKLISACKIRNHLLYTVSDDSLWNRIHEVNILLSPCIIAICSNVYTYSFIVSSIVVYLPIYNHVVMHENLLQNGVSSAVPFLFQAVSTAALHYISLILERRDVSTTTKIKAFSSIATCGVSVCILALIISGSNRATLLTLIQCITLSLLPASQIACITSIEAVAPQGALKQRNVLLGLLALLLSTGSIFLLLAHGRREIVVARFSRHSLSRRRRDPSGTERHEEALRRPPQSEWPIEDPAVVVYGEGEATISLRHEDLPSDSYEDLTSDDEY
ncbi:hypothetical protein ANCDUO_12581 [Ancylostoma duodenale]|uniref:Uncharacterized protein n=1 Tax=Ancylostoma duodenale TaxID=51022 RepID=A0A0C2GE74_9BILA|nr:hypothetical protein ANCDUO_12581 [Ancylostoma duodenale]